MKNYVLLIAILLTAFGIFSGVAKALTYQPEQPGLARVHTLIDEATASATSSAKMLTGAKSATFEFASDGPNGSGNGTTTFKVQVTLDGTTFYDYNKLISNVANTNAETITRVGSVEITATSSALYSMDLSGENYAQARCITVEAGTTTASCVTRIQY